MYYCVGLVISVLFLTCLAQELEETDPVIDGTLTMPTTICDTCKCEDGTVDCNSLGISGFFNLSEWEGLKPHAPTTVDLSHNKLEIVNRISELPIKNLNLSSSEIEEINNLSFQNLEDLETLDLSSNKLTTSSLNRMIFEGKLTFAPGPDGTPIIQGGPAPFRNMKYLSLANNGIHSLPQDLFFCMVSMTTLDLSGNPLAYIDPVTMAAITELTKLKELRLSSCELEALPEGLLRRQRRLERLDLSDNRFTTIPSVLNEAPNLLYLNLDKNSVTSLNVTSGLTSLTKLQELRLCRLSKLQSIGAGALGGLESLEYLRICNNPRLTELDPGALMWEDDQDRQRYPTLKELYLNNNNLSEINSHLLLRWDTLTNVDFTLNPYVCDCSNQWMVDVLVPLIRGTPVNNDSDTNMICAKPQELRGMSFAALRDSGRTLSCAPQEESSLVPTPDMAIMLGIMIGILVTFPIVLVLILLWRKGHFARCWGKMTRDKEEEEDEREDL